MDDLIAKFFTQEITPDEQNALDLWLAEKAENRRYFEQMGQIWAQTADFSPKINRALDVDSALKKTKSRIAASEKGGKKVALRRVWLLAAAAVFAGIFGAVWLFSSEKKTTQTLELAAEKTPLRDTLADGSAIGLNVGSRLAVDFSKKTRRVELRGEAFFQVAKDPEKPFVVRARDLEITVVGTAFNVDNRSDSTLVVVQVSEGRVRVQIGDQILMLAAGEQAVFDCRTGRLAASKMSAVAGADAWLERRFDFDETPLSEVLPMLEKAYNTKITLKNQQLLACKLFTRFRGEPIERVVEVLAETFSLTVERGENSFILDGKTCD